MSGNFLRSVRHCGVNGVAFVLFNLRMQVVCSAPPRKENSGVVLGSLSTESRRTTSARALRLCNLALRFRFFGVYFTLQGHILKDAFVSEYLHIRDEFGWKWKLCERHVLNAIGQIAGHV
jgi:hypothetical protein